MRNAQVSGFQWEEGNKEKCRKHGVPLDVIEDIFNRLVMTFPDDHSDAETRFKAIGKAKDNRHVFVVFTLRRDDENLLIRPISARYIHQKEITAYEKENPDIQE
ncbi:MAG: BrnT family toxin [Chlorobium sp.]